jgi:hypothetical protein
VPALGGEVDDRRRAKSTVEVVMEEHLRGSQQLVARRHRRIVMGGSSPDLWRIRDAPLVRDMIGTGGAPRW